MLARLCSGLESAPIAGQGSRQSIPGTRQSSHAVSEETDSDGCVAYRYRQLQEHGLQLPVWAELSEAHVGPRSRHPAVKRQLAIDLANLAWN